MEKRLLKRSSIVYTDSRNQSCKHGAIRILGTRETCLDVYVLPKLSSQSIFILIFSLVDFVAIIRHSQRPVPHLHKDLRTQTAAPPPTNASTFRNH